MVCLVCIKGLAVIQKWPGACIGTGPEASRCSCDEWSVCCFCHRCRRVSVLRDRSWCLDRRTDPWVQCHTALRARSPPQQPGTSLHTHTRGNTHTHTKRHAIQQPTHYILVLLILWSCSVFLTKLFLVFH